MEVGEVDLELGGSENGGSTELRMREKEGGQRIQWGQIVRTGGLGEVGRYGQGWAGPKGGGEGGGRDRSGRRGSGDAGGS